MLGLFKRAPKLEAVFRPTVAVARELTREVEVAGELLLRNLGRAAELTDLELVLIGGGTRRIDLAVPEAWRGRLPPAQPGPRRRADRPRAGADRRRHAAHRPRRARGVARAAGTSRSR